MQQLLPDFRAWRLDIRALHSSWAVTPGHPGDRKLAWVNTDQVLATLESPYQGGTGISPQAISPRRTPRTYRVLGAYRALSAALLDIPTMQGDQMGTWRQERFKRIEHRKA